MTKKEKEKIKEITNQWFRNCQYYESNDMPKALRFEVGRLAALMHLCYEFGIDAEINHTDIHHYIMYQREKENWNE